MFSLLFTYHSSPETRLKPYILELNFVSDPGPDGEQGTLPPAKFLASKILTLPSANLVFHSNVRREDFCFIMKITSFRSTCTATGPGFPQIKFNNLFNNHFP